MSIIRNLSGAFVPVREARETSGILGALNAELVLDTNGDENAVITIIPSAFAGTLEFTYSTDSTGTNFFPLPVFPFPPGCVGGTIPVGGQPLLTEALVVGVTARTYSALTGGIKRVRVRVSAYTSGTLVATIRSDAAATFNLAMVTRPSTLLVTATAAAGAGATVTLPAVPGLRHVIDFIRVTRSASALLTAGAAPTVVTTTNLPGSPALTFGQDAAAQGVDKEVVLDFGGSGLAASAINTNTTVVCPATTNVIWRATVSYRLGL